MYNNDLTKKALVNTYYDSSTKKLYEVNSDGTVGGEIKMGGYPTLNYTTPLWSPTGDKLSYTATKDCYLVGNMAGTNSSITINNVVYFANGSEMRYGILLKLTAGDTVKCSFAMPNIRVCKEL